jgi:hypothetical protein
MQKITTFFVAIIATLLVVPSVAQDKKPLSPKETVEGVVGGANTKIVYCRPSARNRKMIGGKEPYGEIWRTGANEATTIEFDKPVKIEGKDLPAGKYALFTIPKEDKWTIIFNKKHNQWGSYDYNDKEDALRVDVKPGKPKQFVETFTITPEEDQISLQWENTVVAFKVKS